ncbi:MAG TPA: 4Fe-4S binding protein [Methanobacterium sp.]|nr:4Fe-4S binding protein [Methanobacterium sp.]
MNIKSATAIFFSPTSSTKKIAFSILKGMNIEITNTVNLNLKENREKLNYKIETDIAIIGVPVYGGRIPNGLYNFFKTVQGNGVPTVLVTVYGNVSRGSALEELYTLTAKKLDIVAMASFIGQHSFSTKEVPLGENRPNLEDLKIATDFGKSIQIKLKDANSSKKDNLIQLSKRQIFIGNFMNFIHAMPQRAGKIFIKEPLVDLTKCIKCGECAKQCPKQAINNESLQIDRELCIGCFNCVKVCPVEARKLSYKYEKLLAWYLKRANRTYKTPELYI